ncbi:hypothetical protein AWZ03_010882 [Drosophila navojoa]|uniref:Uncharacterized protein n=1 Tax=Drosophila navojoa TaxID=7232 RepID=A0A484B1V0_DRONA|nr:hypothetical protein AWZ03_010882 [Drosophila navojoa]
MYPSTRSVATMTTNTVVESTTALRKLNIMTYSTSTQTIAIKDMPKPAPSAPKLDQTQSNIDGLTSLFTELKTCKRAQGISTPTRNHNRETLGL